MFTKNDDQTLDKKLKKIFLEIFEYDIDDGSTIEDVDLWDSMGHINLIMELETAFSVQIQPENIITLTSIKAIKDYLGANK
jgi:acyl carrier protein